MGEDRIIWELGVIPPKKKERKKEKKEKRKAKTCFGNEAGLGGGANG